MAGIKNKRNPIHSPKKRTHLVHDVLEADLYKEAKAIVHENSDKFNNL
jgi:hypothetical protein